jgi:hypothetical protein
MNEQLIPDILKPQAKQFLKWSIIILIINILMIVIDPYSTTTDLTGQVSSGWSVKISAIFTSIIGIAIISLILSLIISIIPYKELSYGQKFFFYALVIYFIIQCLFCLIEAKNLWHEFTMK